jgi:hypothetical protein
LVSTVSFSAAEEIDLLDDMLSALVEILEEKGVLTQEEWEKKIQAKIEKAKGMTRFRNLPP